MSIRTLVPVERLWGIGPFSLIDHEEKEKVT